MKKNEIKKLTIEDLKKLCAEYNTADKDKKDEMWNGFGEETKQLFHVVRNTQASCYKIITDKLIVDDIWAHDIDNLNYGFTKYNITEFLFKDTSTQAVAIIIRFMELGWEVVGVEDWALLEKFGYNENQPKRYFEPMQGIVFRKKGVDQ